MLMMAVVGGMPQVTPDKVIYHLPCKWVTKDSHNHSFWGWEPRSRTH